MTGLGRLLNDSPVATAGVEPEGPSVGNLH